MNTVDLVLNELKRSKKYKSLHEDLLIPIILKHLPETQDTRTKEFKDKIKSIKRELHKAYAAYIQNKRRIETLLKKGASEEEIMALHSSTKERLPYYKEFYSSIFKITGKPKRVADIGCGLNPLSYKYFGCKPFYFAMDVDPFVINVVNTYFNMKAIGGRAVLGSALELKYDFKDYDVVLMLKLLPLLESQRKGITEQLLSQIKSRYIVFSLPTRSLSSRKPLDTSFFKEKIPYKKLIKFPNEEVLIYESPVV